MRTLRLSGPQTVRVADAPWPEMTAPTSAIVRITAASICGSDLGPYRNGSHFGGHSVGHEAVGIIESVGGDVQDRRPGERVVLLGTAGCGTCERCRRNEAMLCDATPYPPVYGHGFPGLGGGQSEALEVPMADFNLAPLPENVPDEVGVLLADTLPTASAALDRVQLERGGSVAVIGLGAVGLQVALVAKARGARRIVGIDLLEDRRRYAATLGIEVVNPVSTDLTAFEPVDAVIDANGSAATLSSALSIVRKGGSVAVVGIPSSETVPIPAQLAMGKSVSVHWIACSIQKHVPQLLEEIASGALPMTPLVELFTHRLPLESGPRAYELFASRGDGVVKVLIETGATAAPTGRN